MMISEYSTLSVSEKLHTLDEQARMEEEPLECEAIPWTAAGLKTYPYPTRRSALKRPYIMCSVKPRVTLWSFYQESLAASDLIDVPEIQEPRLEKSILVTKVTDHLLSLIDDSSNNFGDFQGEDLPEISLLDYVDRIVRYAETWANQSSPEGERTEPIRGMYCVLMAVEYLDRLNMGIPILAMHRLFMCASLVAMKFTDDFKVSNIYWSKVGGVEVDELNKLECRFCVHLQWHFNVRSNDFEAQCLRYST